MGFAVSEGSLTDKLTEKVQNMDAEDFNHAGELFYVSNRFRSAERSFKTALAVLERQGKTNSETEALVKSNLGLLYHTTGRFTLAEKYTTEALKIRRDVLENNQGLGASLNNLGVLYKDLGKYNLATENLDKAISLTGETAGKNSSEYAIVLNNIAILNQELGKYDVAAEKLKESISIAKEGLRKKSANFVRLKVNLALLYQLQGKLNEAEEIFLDAMRIKRNRLGTNHPDYAVMLRNIASLYMVKENYDQVEENLKKAFEIYSKKFGEEHHAYAATLVDLAKYYLFTNNLKEARSNLTKAINIQEKVLGSNHPWLTESKESLAVLNWKEGDMKSAAEIYNVVMAKYIDQINTFFPTMSEVDKMRFWEKLHPRFLRYYNFVLRTNEEMPRLKGKMFNLHIATKALLLNVTSKVKKEILNSDNEELVDQYNEWLDIKEQLSRLYTYSKKELLENNINIDSLENVANDKEKYLSKASELFSRGYSIQQVGYNDISAQLEDLTSGKTTLFISPDGIFYQINLNTIRKENGDYLIDEKNFVYLTNSKDLISYKEKKEKEIQGNNDAILIGDPDYDMNFDWDQMNISGQPDGKQIHISSRMPLKKK